MNFSKTFRLFRWFGKFPSSGLRGRDFWFENRQNPSHPRDFSVVWRLSNFGRALSISHVNYWELWLIGLEEPWNSKIKIFLKRNQPLIENFWSYIDRIWLKKIRNIFRKFSKIFRIFWKLFVRFVLSKIFPEIGRAETIRLVQKSSNFELSSRFFGRLKTETKVLRKHYY